MDPLRRACHSYSGLGGSGTYGAGILQSHTSQGRGYFLLPGLSLSPTTSPITGGRVVVTP